jgi:hypothetical protein
MRLLAQCGRIERKPAVGGILVFNTLEKRKGAIEVLLAIEDADAIGSTMMDYDKPRNRNWSDPTAVHRDEAAEFA